MKAFAGTIAAGLVALAVAAALAHRGGRAAPRALPQGAEDAVLEYLSAVTALYETGGDSRVAERIPASPGLVSEMISDIAFAQHRLQTREWRHLIRLERGGSARLADGGVEVRTREFWIFQQGPLMGQVPAGAATSAIWNVRYELTREGAAWRVVDYRLEPLPAGRDRERP